MSKLFNRNINPVQVSDTGLVRMRMMGTVTRRTFSLGLAGVGAAAAFGLPGRSASAATAVSYIGWQDYDTGLDVDNWFEKNDIVLKTTYIGTNEEIIAAASAGGVGVMDLCTPAVIYLDIYEQAGILEPLELDRIPNWKLLFPELRDLITVNSDNTVSALPFQWGDVPLMYNAEVIKEPPTSWHDLLKPEYKGKVALVYDVMGIMVHSPMAVTGTKTPTYLTREELDATIDWLIKIKKEHALTICNSYGDLGALFASGEVLMAPAWTPTAIWAGPDVPELKWVIPKEGMLVFSDVLSMVKDAPNKDVNYKILNHSLSPEAQANTANLIMTAVCVADAVPLLDDVPRDLYQYDDITGWFEKSGGPFPGWPIDPPQGIMSFDEILDGWERFISA